MKTVKYIDNRARGFINISEMTDVYMVEDGRILGRKDFDGEFIIYNGHLVEDRIHYNRIVIIEEK